MRAMSFFFSSRRRHTRWPRDWSSDVCSSDLRDYADWRPIPSELLEQNEVCKAVQDAINSLNPSYREVLVLRDIQNLSIKETTDRKSTRLNSSHVAISYAVFCLKKKKKKTRPT